MPITADSTRLRKRLSALTTALPHAANRAIAEAAEAATGIIQTAVRAEWGNHNQVGFDLDHFIWIIGHVEPIEGGGVGILNNERMGTAENFERIKGIRGLWHQGTGQGAKFGLFINQTGWIFDHVAELIQDRQSYWGGTEPQWALIEYGTTGQISGPGAYDPRPPTMTITNTALDMAPRVYAMVENTVMSILRRNGVYG